MIIIGRKRYKKFGYLYHPDYVSLWCDNEYTDINKRDGKIKYINEVIIKHENFNNIGKKGDPLHKKNESFYHKDQHTYQLRKANGFPKESVL